MNSENKLINMQDLRYVETDEIISMNVDYPKKSKSDSKQVFESEKATPNLHQADNGENTEKEPEQAAPEVQAIKGQDIGFIVGESLTAEQSAWFKEKVRQAGDILSVIKTLVQDAWHRERTAESESASAANAIVKPNEKPRDDGVAQRKEKARLAALARRDKARAAREARKAAIAERVDGDPLMSAEDIAQYLGVTTKTVHNLCAAGKLKGAFKAGRAWRIPESSYREYITRGDK